MPTTTAIPIRMHEIRLSRKTVKLPFDIINDWRSAVYMIGPITKASTIGANG